MVYEAVKSKIRSSASNNFEGFHLEMNEKVFHVLSSLALNEHFRNIIKVDKQVLKSMVNELQFENLIKVEG